MSQFRTPDHVLTMLPEKICIESAIQTMVSHDISNRVFRLIIVSNHSTIPKVHETTGTAKAESTWLFRYRGHGCEERIVLSRLWKNGSQPKAYRKILSNDLESKVNYTGSYAEIKK